MEETDTGEGSVGQAAWGPYTFQPEFSLISALSVPQQKKRNPQEGVYNVRMRELTIHPRELEEGWGRGCSPFILSI